VLSKPDDFDASTAECDLQIISGNQLPAAAGRWRFGKRWWRQSKQKQADRREGS